MDYIYIYIYKTFQDNYSEFQLILCLLYFIHIFCYKNKIFNKLTKLEESN